MGSIIVPLFSETAGWTVEIDGRVYRPALIDSAGHLQIDVISSALPTGAATSALQGTIITALQYIDDLRNALASVGTDELMVRLYGTAETYGIASTGRQDTMITALQLIDDLRGALGEVAADELRTNIIAALPAGTNKLGSVDIAGSTKTLTHTALSAPNNGENTIFTASAGKTFYIVHILYSVKTAGEVWLMSGSDYLIGSSSYGVYLAADGGFVENGSVEAPLYKATGPAAAFKVKNGGALEGAGHVVWYEE